MVVIDIIMIYIVQYSDKKPRPNRVLSGSSSCRTRSAPPRRAQRTHRGIHELEASRRSLRHRAVPPVYPPALHILSTARAARSSERGSCLGKAGKEFREF